MKKRFWIKVSALQLSDLTPGNRGKIWGNLLVGRQGFTMCPISLTLEKDGHLTQNYNNGNIRLRDVPILHQAKGRRIPKFLLADVIAKAVCDEYLRARKDEVIAFIEKGVESDFPWFTPTDWLGSLRIPVDFIELFSFSSRKEDGPVFANIQLGHHLIFWDVILYDPKRRYPFQFRTSYFNDPQALAAVQRMLTRPKIRKFIKEVSANGRLINSGQFLDQVPSAKPHSLPPRIRFY